MKPRARRCRIWTSTLRFYIGGVEAQILFKGRAPGQVRIHESDVGDIPDGLPTGCNVSVVSSSASSATTLSLWWATAALARTSRSDNLPTEGFNAHRSDRTGRSSGKLNWARDQDYVAIPECRRTPPSITASSFSRRGGRPRSSALTSSPAAAPSAEHRQRRQRGQRPGRGRCVHRESTERHEDSRQKLRRIRSILVRCR